MICMRSRNRFFRLSKIILGLILAGAVLTTGQLFYSNERQIVMTQRLEPDPVHNVALELKGKTFYVSPPELHTYHLYQRLFLAEVGLIWVLIFCDLVWNKRIRGPIQVRGSE